MQPLDSRHAGNLILCGGEEVSILKLTQQQGCPFRKLWSWRAKERHDLPGYLKSSFDTTDECKPVCGGAELLITSSGGGAALVDARTDKVSFYATTENAHSADILPRGRVAVALSHAPGGKGDRIVIFDLDARDRELSSDELPWGHGVVWDKHRQTLWGLSDIDIRAYKLENWDGPSPTLSRSGCFELPERGGHDLYPVGKSALLSVTTSEHCWLFDRDKCKFLPHPVLADAAGIKSIAVNPVTGQLAYIQAEGEHWWSETVHLLHPEGRLHLAGERLYKARWDLEAH